MKKYFCDFCERELFGSKLTMKSNNPDFGFNINSNIEDEEIDFTNWSRLDFCSKDHMLSKLFGE